MSFQFVLMVYCLMTLLEWQNSKILLAMKMHD